MSPENSLLPPSDIQPNPPAVIHRTIQDYAGLTSSTTHPTVATSNDLSSRGSAGRKRSSPDSAPSPDTEAAPKKPRFATTAPLVDSLPDSVDISAAAADSADVPAPIPEPGSPVYPPGAYTYISFALGIPPPLNSAGAGAYHNFRLERRRTFTPNCLHSMLWNMVTSVALAKTAEQDQRGATESEGDPIAGAPRARGRSHRRRGTSWNRSGRGSGVEKSGGESSLPDPLLASSTPPTTTTWTTLKPLSDPVDEASAALPMSIEDEVMELRLSNLAAKIAREGNKGLNVW